jgi:hypothetical protein
MIAAGEDREEQPLEPRPQQICNQHSSDNGIVLGADLHRINRGLSIEPVPSAECGIVIDDGPLGLSFGARLDGTQEVLRVGYQCREKNVEVGDTLVAVAGRALQGVPKADIVAMIQGLARPFRLVFDRKRPHVNTSRGTEEDQQHHHQQYQHRHQRQQGRVCRAQGPQRHRPPRPADAAWTGAEEAYMRRLVSEFSAGCLPLPKGTALVLFLQKALRAEPERVARGIQMLVR